MILVNIEYDHDKLQKIYQANIKYHELREMIDRIEAMVGNVLYEEMSEIECRLRPFGIYDDHDHDVFITVDCDQDFEHKLTENLSEQAQAILKDIFYHDVKTKVWVRKIVTL